MPLNFSTSNLYAFIIAQPNFPTFNSSIWQVMTNKAKRDQIFALKTDKVKQLKVCRQIAYNARKQFQESDTMSGKSIPGRTRTISTKTIIFVAKKKIKRNP